RLRRALEIAARVAPVTAAPAMQRKAVALVLVSVAAAVSGVALKVLRARLRSALPLLAAGNEGWQPLDVAAVMACRLMQRLGDNVLRLACRKRRPVAVAGRERLRVGRQERLRIAGAEGGFGCARHGLLSDVVAA